VSDSIAVDTNAVVDYLRAYRKKPPRISDAEEVWLPLPVLGELYAGAFRSERVDENVKSVEDTAAIWRLLQPDRDTSRYYGRLTANEPAGKIRSARSERARRNDLWIAALCVQHQLPLLSNDRDFDGIEGLEVIHW
jgi:tRNA(fMet)-specific endonuclease VapC